MEVDMGSGMVASIIGNSQTRSATAGKWSECESHSQIMHDPAIDMERPMAGFVQIWSSLLPPELERWVKATIDGYL